MAALIRSTQRLVLRHKLLSSPHSLLLDQAFNCTNLTTKHGLSTMTVSDLENTKLSATGPPLIRPYPTSPYLLKSVLEPMDTDTHFHFVNAEYIVGRGHRKPKYPVRCFASTRGWLGLIDLNDCSLLLHRPSLDDYNVDGVQLPPLPSLPSITGEGPSTKQFLMLEIFSHDMMRNCMLSSEPHDDGCILMAIYGSQNSLQLAYCRPGQDDVWTVLHDSNPSSDQLVHSDKKKTFYTLAACDDGSSGIEAWDFSDPSCPKRTNFMNKSLPIPPMISESEKLLREQCKNKNYLVVDEPSGDLLLVIKYYADHMSVVVPAIAKDLGERIYTQKAYQFKTQRFDVFKVNFAGKSMEYLNCLPKGRVLFLGFNHSFSLTTDWHPNLMPETIYFADDVTQEIPTKSCPYKSHFTGIYYYAKHRIGPFPPFESPCWIKEPCFWVAPGASERPPYGQSPWGIEADEKLKMKMFKMYTE